MKNNPAHTELVKELLTEIEAQSLAFEAAEKQLGCTTVKGTQFFDAGWDAAMEYMERKQNEI